MSGDIEGSIGLVATKELPAAFSRKRRTRHFRSDMGQSLHRLRETEPSILGGNASIVVLNRADFRGVESLLLISRFPGRRRDLRREWTPNVAK
jgi:hypothetical protein